MHPDDVLKRKILLFLKKKKQKDFLSFSGPGTARRDSERKDESFLVLFFKREHSSCRIARFEKLGMTRLL